MNEYGNNAVMREALVKIREYIITGNTGYESKELLELILNWCDSSLTAPPRNCDVGTAEEQSRRFDAFCAVHHFQSEKGCSGCPCHGADSCEFKWAQMPYREKEKGTTNG